jgi:hypothetical protein
MDQSILLRALELYLTPYLQEVDRLDYTADGDLIIITEYHGFQIIQRSCHHKDVLRLVAIVKDNEQCFDRWYEHPRSLCIRSDHDSCIKTHPETYFSVNSPDLLVLFNNTILANIQVGKDFIDRFLHGQTWQYADRLALPGIAVIKH